ncbi:DUF3467 domain-containing protein [Kiritimatiellota bacterium B12222]|nr:DUF3467 domain-containing protein [Kiritimatiellota bacterium B12222]
MSKNQNTDSTSKRIRVKYEDHTARYANQVVLNGSAEEIFLDFSSGPLPDPATGESVIPIHTRIAMSHSAARRLVSALQQTLKRIDAGSTGPSAKS